MMSAYEPESRADGSIDPLGLQADAGRLADLLLPGFTVRVDRLRALTIATAINYLARQLSPEKQLPYRICLERIFLHALVAKTETTLDPAVRGFPGRLKARNALNKGEPLTLERYVKGPATNGLVGVYGSLARWSALFGEEGVLLARCDGLLGEWEREIQLPGLVTGGSSSSGGLRRDIEKVARRDLDSGVFEPSSVRDALFQIARFDRAGPKERDALFSALSDDDAAPQRYVLARLREELPGYRNWVSGDGDADAAERIGRGGFERGIAQRWQTLTGSSEAEAIALVARASLTYEHVSQLLTAAFDGMRWCAGQAVGRAITIAEVATNASARPVLEEVVQQLPEALHELALRCAALATQACGCIAWKGKPGEVAASTARLIDAFQGLQTPVALLEAVMARHRKVQDAKRKGYWALIDSAGYRFLGGYQLAAEAPPAAAPEFVHAFRFANALSILRDVEN
jgi:hypothetical protein